MRSENLMTVREATNRFFKGLTVRYVRKLARQGQFGDLVRLKNVWLIREKGIDEFIEARRVTVDRHTGNVPDPLAETKLENLTQ